MTEQEVYIKQLESELRDCKEKLEFMKGFVRVLRLDLKCLCEANSGVEQVAAFNMLKSTLRTYAGECSE